MFCPKCGKPNQSEETFCRQCGTFLPDLDKSPKKHVSPAEHVTANLILSAMTVVISFTLAALLYYFDFGWPDASVLTYATAGFLIAIGCWNVQTLWRSLLLRKHFKEAKARREQAFEAESPVEEKATGKMLPDADFAQYEPASVTDYTTRHLTEPKTRSS